MNQIIGSDLYRVKNVLQNLVKLKPIRIIKKKLLTEIRDKNDFFPFRINYPEINPRHDFYIHGHLKSPHIYKKTKLKKVAKFCIKLFIIFLNGTGKKSHPSGIILQFSHLQISVSKVFEWNLGVKKHVFKR